MANRDDLRDLTSLLNRLDGSRASEERVFQLVYGELRRIAHCLVAQEAGGNAFQPTELVHETYLKKLRRLRVPIRDRQHFYSIATRAMRQVLIEEARRRQAEKRQAPQVSQVINAGTGWLDPLRVLELAPLLDKLQEIDPRAASVVDLRFFLGCSLEETAEVLGASVRNVRDDWDFARLWLQGQLGGGA